MNSWEGGTKKELYLLAVVQIIKTLLIVSILHTFESVQK